MNWEQFMKGITILYAFGLATKDDWELKVWHRALQGEMEAEEYEDACMCIAKNNTKFWETDNIPAQLLEIIADKKQKRAAQVFRGRMLAEDQNREMAKASAIASYDSEEDRLECLEKFKKMNSEIWKKIPTENGG